MNLWFWPFLAEPSGNDLELGTGHEFLSQTLFRYGIFYLVTSLVVGCRALDWKCSWLLVALGAPLLRLLRRFYERFHFTAFE